MALYQTTVQTVPPTGFPITVELARQNARVTTTADDNLLSMFIATATDITERYLNRALVTRTLQYTIAEVVPKSDWPLISVPFVVLPLAIEFAISHQQRTSTPLLYSPVTEVISASYGKFGQADTQLTLGTDYDVDLLTEPARVHWHSTVPWYESNHLSVVYQAGYGTADQIPPTIINAITIATTFLFNSRGGSDTNIPEAFFNLLDPYRLITFPSTT